MSKEQEVINKIYSLKRGEKFIYHRGASGDLELDSSLSELRKATANMRELETHIFVQRKTGKKYEINGRQTHLNEFEYWCIAR